MFLSRPGNSVERRTESRNKEDRRVACTRRRYLSKGPYYSSETQPISKILRRVSDKLMRVIRLTHRQHSADYFGGNSPSFKIERNNKPKPIIPMPANPSSLLGWLLELATAHQ